jgi:glycolate oxidase
MLHQQADSMVVKDLRALVGAENAIVPESADPSKLEEYAKDMADYPSQPLVVVRPSSPDQVSQILAYARRNKVPVVARGAGTSLTGATSSHGGIVMDFSKRMNRILKIDTVNWYVQCEPGIALDDLNAELKKVGFFFPPDPSSAPWCTVGGAIAENSGGMKCFRYGTVKDWVLALRVVLSDGSIVKLGEALPKNRVGYDLVHLICGSEGTLAVIVEAWLKIAPLPALTGEEHKRLLVFFERWEDAGRAIQAIRAKGIQPVLLEFIDRDTIKSINDSFELEIPEHAATLFMEATSRLDETLELCEENGSTGKYLAKDEKDGERLYSARALAYLGVKALASGSHTEDVVVPIDRLAEYLGLVRRIGEKYGLKIPTAGHAGDGNVHPVILYDRESKESEEKAEKAFAEICRYAIEVGGSVTGEHGIGEQKIEFAREQLLKHGGEQVPGLMKDIKKIWDPDNVLNPGKFQ